MKKRTKHFILTPIIIDKQYMSNSLMFITHYSIVVSRYKEILECLLMYLLITLKHPIGHPYQVYRQLMKA